MWGSMIPERYIVVVVLFVVPSVMVEFLTGNTTIAIFTEPLSLIMLFGSYGSGALLVRELTRRWRKDFVSVLILGAVYGMFNEGLQTGGFFDPHFYAVAANGLENYGRWGGINVVWALGIITFHAVFSIAIPIALVDALFPAIASQRLLNNAGLIAFVCLLFAVTIVQRAILTFRQPPINPYAFVFTIIVMCAFVFAARSVPAFGLGARRKIPKNTTLFFSALFASISWLIIIPRVLGFIHAPILDVVTMIGLLSFAFWFILGFDDFSIRNRLFIAAGAEGPVMAHAILSGVFVPAAVTFALLILASWRSNCEAGRAPTLAPSAVPGFSGGPGPR